MLTVRQCSALRKGANFSPQGQRAEGASLWVRVKRTGLLRGIQAPTAQTPMKQGCRARNRQRTLVCNATGNLALVLDCTGVGPLGNPSPWPDSGVHDGGLLGKVEEVGAKPWGEPEPQKLREEKFPSLICRLSLLKEGCWQAREAH